ncbi:MAG: histidinol dehydrogenase, partial [Helicobacter sp.]|nr:histidinol dehydrogenase [Helicobacter sp.]
MPNILILNEQQEDFQTHFDNLLKRGEMDICEVQGRVLNLLKAIKERGLEAVLEQVSNFDGWNPKSLEELTISKDSMKQAYDSLNQDLKAALECAYERIFAFHQKQKPKTWLDFEKNGTILGQKVTPMKRAGLYIPGGKAAYPSSLLMNAIPALVAGVEEIVVCTPTPHNQPNALLLAAMHLCGITQAYKIGGASAIGTMAYGISGIPKVDIIAGPGNIYVATAKKLVFGDVHIDMVAGPSEIGILADSKANADYIAWDLLSQAEHDEMASSILITTDENLAQKVSGKID